MTWLRVAGLVVGSIQDPVLQRSQSTAEVHAPFAGVGEDEVLVGVAGKHQAHQINRSLVHTPLWTQRRLRKCGRGRQEVALAAEARSETSFCA